MGRTFDERKYLREYLEMHPEYQPKPGYITREGLVSFARWLIEEGYCKLGREADTAVIQVVLLYLHSKKLFERCGRRTGEHTMYKINWEKEDICEFVRLAAEIEELILQKAEIAITPRRWAWIAGKDIEQKAKELGVPASKLISVGKEAGLLRNWWGNKRIQAVKVWEKGKIWTQKKHYLEEYRSLKSILKEQGYSLKDPDVAWLLKRLRKRSVSPNPTFTV
jgi:hypothetical protein